MEELKKNNCSYKENLVGMVFGKLTVEYKCEPPKKNSYHCRCECGNEIELTASLLVTGHRSSCDNCCKHRIFSGDSHTRFYRILSGAKRRCYKESAKDYPRYGGRGIRVCDRWLDSYLNFKEDMYESYLKHCEEFGERNTTLDRIDYDGNYTPENCCWVTWAEQERNKRNNIYVTIGGVRKSLKDFSEELGFDYNRVYGRLCRGMDIMEAIAVPTDKLLASYFYKGMSLHSYCKKNNLNYDTVISRIDYGWSIEAAVEAPKGTRYEYWIHKDDNISPEEMPVIYYEGKPLKKYCEENALSYARIYYRVHKFGWDLESAVKAPKNMRYKTWLKMKENDKKSLDKCE